MCVIHILADDTRVKDITNKVVNVDNKTLYDVIKTINRRLQKNECR